MIENVITNLFYYIVYYQLKFIENHKFIDMNNVFVERII